jgi:hypothetical protein
MTLLVAKEKIISVYKGNTYAKEMDILKLIELRGNVGLYYNLHTKDSFPASPSKVKKIDSRLYIRPETKAGVKQPKTNPGQLTLF